LIDCEQFDDLRTISLEDWTLHYDETKQLIVCDRADDDDDRPAAVYIFEWK
jgi:hypothetical protein